MTVRYLERYDTGNCRTPAMGKYLLGEVTDPSHHGRSFFRQKNKFSENNNGCFVLHRDSPEAMIIIIRMADVDVLNGHYPQLHHEKI